MNSDTDTGTETESVSGSGQPSNVDDARNPASSASRPAITYRDDYRAGQNALSRGRPDEALPRFEKIPLDSADIGRDAAYQAAQIYQSRGQLSRVYAKLKAVSQRYPRERTAHQQLASLLAMVGMRSEADVHVRALAELGELKLEELVLLTDFDRRHPRYGDLLQMAESRAPEDAFVQLGLATEAFLLRDYADCRTRLNTVLAADPTNEVALGLLGEVLVEIDAERLPEWFEGLTAESRESWEVKFALGRWSQISGERPQAVRCFRECLDQNQMSYRLWFYLSTVLTELNAPEAEAYRIRADEIYRMRSDLSLVLNSGGKNVPALRRLIEALHSLGRYDDELRWLHIAETRHPADPWIRRRRDMLSKQPRANRRTAAGNASLDTLPSLAAYPEFRRPDHGDSAAVQATVPAQPSRIQFVDQAAELGVLLQFEMGRPAETREVRMFESTGGGVGILDIDGDGLPDMFLTQGLHWPSQADRPVASPLLSDKVFRNRSTVFEDITEVCGVAPESDYGQGCSVGDINDDGFPDVYVANIGVNRLLLNNGDGTFTDVTQQWGITGDQWTTSCLIADIDGDGNSDLYDVNYLKGQRVFRDSCSEHGCSTAPFDGAVDEVCWSGGDGTFQMTSRDAEGTDGPGLGIVAFLEPQGPQQSPGPARIRPALTLFVGNDGKPDYLLNIAATSAGVSGQRTNTITLEDSGFLRGVAVNGDGKNTSTMGIAVGDLNGDARMDLFVTNYSAEANSLFLQQDGGYFADRVSETALKAPGIPLIGWGTQFVDFDCDGLLDVFIANGHVADFQQAGVEYAMPTHVFQQLPGWQFSLLPPKQLGPYFAVNRLGRAVATTDWNRDGRMDLVMGSIDTPVAVLTNTTQQTGRWISVRLFATQSARDAIGAIVTVSCGSTTSQAQLTAGSGFHASNERLLHFGLGHGTDDVCTVSIRWPSGHVDQLESIPVNATLSVREGMADAWLSSTQQSDVTRHSIGPSNR